MEPIYQLLLNQNLVTLDSRQKIQNLSFDIKSIPYLHPKLRHTLRQMITCFQTPCQIKAITPPITENEIKPLFRNLDQRINQVEQSKLQKELETMNKTYSFELVTQTNANNASNMNNTNDIVTIHFLVDSSNSTNAYMAAILHAIHIFCSLIEYHYHGLVIYVCLDSTTRTLDFPKNLTDYDKIFQILHKKSAAFNVSGVTSRANKIIVLTKKEEIIKLLYHELVHFTELDFELTKQMVNFPWAIKNSKLNLSEAYAEFMSVIFYTAYVAIQLAGLYHFDPYDTYRELLTIEINYSLFLSSVILKFYDYDSNTVYHFFAGIGQKKYSPILVWEYILLRTIMLQHLNEMLELVPDNYRVNAGASVNIRKLLLRNNDLSDQMRLFIDKIHDLDDSSVLSVSYLMIDLDWNRI